MGGTVGVLAPPGEPQRRSNPFWGSRTWWSEGGAVGMAGEQDYVYQAWCRECGRTTQHQYGSCREHRPEGFPRVMVEVGSDGKPKERIAAVSNRVRKAS